MKVTLERDLLVNVPPDVMPTPAGTVVEMEDSRARELIERGLVTEGSRRRADTKMAREPKNKAESDSTSAGVIPPSAQPPALGAEAGDDPAATGATGRRGTAPATRNPSAK